MKLQQFHLEKPKQRAQQIIQRLEKNFQNLEKMKQRNIIRVERLLSINMRNLGYTCNYTMTIDNRVEGQRCFLSKKKNRQLKLDSFYDDVKSRNDSTLSPNRNYWARLAYRQSHLESDKQHRVL